MGYLMGLFFSLKQQLLSQRAANREAAAAVATAQMNSPLTHTLPDSFTDGGHSSVATAQRNMSQQDSFDPGLAQGNTIPTVLPTSSRTNLEESNMMKREMQNQMAFQNKMRALKQQELNKYRRTEETGDVLQDQQYHAHSVDHQPPDQQQQHTPTNHAVLDGKQPSVQFADQVFQGAGETAGADESTNRERSRALSIGTDDFWNSDVVDDQLFEFLMND